jgi:hypothetical protein
LACRIRAAGRRGGCGRHRARRSAAGASTVTTWLRAWWSRLTAGLALVGVASVTGVIRYTHVYDLTVSLHQPLMVARLMPFGVDELIVLAQRRCADETPRTTRQSQRLPRSESLPYPSLECSPCGHTDRARPR